MLFHENMEHIVEGLIFMSADPMRPEDLAQVTGVDSETLRDICEDLCEKYRPDKGGFTLRRIDGGYLFYASSLLTPYLEKLYAPRMRNLSPAAYETLAIVAYQGPVTRSDIESIRGVRSDGPLNQLLQRGLVEERGRRDSPGRPILYATGPYFMQAFGLDSLEDLDHYDKVQDLIAHHKAAGEETDESSSPADGD